MSTKNPITVETVVARDGETVWRLWTIPEHIEAWNHASEDWECPKAENDLRVGGHFSAVMAAKDGSASFDFNGTYTTVDPGRRIEYVIEGGRQVRVCFESTDQGIRVIEEFEPENVNSRELQQAGWQSILESFKRYAEQLEA